MPDRTTHHNTGDVTIHHGDVALLRAMLDRASDWDATAEQRADARCELGGLLGYLIGGTR